jgi:hypothetical protein
VDSEHVRLLVIGTCHGKHYSIMEMVFFTVIEDKDNTICIWVLCVWILAPSAQH